MDTATARNQLIKSLSFDVVATTQYNMIGDEDAVKMTPLNVRIRVRKKDGHHKGVLIIPKPGQTPFSTTEKVRVASSDQTIMSFDMLIEADPEKKAIKKPRRSFFGVCLGVKETESDQYLPSKTDVDDDDHPDIKVEKLSSARARPLNKPAYNNNASSSYLIRRNDKVFGKCKPGGCLDPPFGEDKYSYQPNPQRNKLTAKIDANKKESVKENTPSKTLNKIDSKKKHSISIMSNATILDPNYVNIKNETVLSSHQRGATDATDELESIITYPPALSSRELISADEKNVPHRKFSSRQTGNSFNEINTKYFSPPRSPRDSKDSKGDKRKQLVVQQILAPKKYDCNKSNIDTPISADATGHRPSQKSSSQIISKTAAAAGLVGVGAFAGLVGAAAADKYEKEKDTVGQDRADLAIGTRKHMSDKQDTGIENPKAQNEDTVKSVHTADLVATSRSGASNVTEVELEKIWQESANLSCSTKEAAFYDTNKEIFKLPVPRIEDKKEYTAMADLGAKVLENSEAPKSEGGKDKVEQETIGLGHRRDNDDPDIGKEISRVSKLKEERDKFLQEIIQLGLDPRKVKSDVTQDKGIVVPEAQKKCSATDPKKVKSDVRQDKEVVVPEAQNKCSTTTPATDELVAISDLGRFGISDSTKPGEGKYKLRQENTKLSIDAMISDDNLVTGIEAPVAHNKDSTRTGLIEISHLESVRLPSADKSANRKDELFKEHIGVGLSDNKQDKGIITSETHNKYRATTTTGLAAISGLGALEISDSVNLSEEKGKVRLDSGAANSISDDDKDRATAAATAGLGAISDSNGQGLSDVGKNENIERYTNITDMIVNINPETKKTKTGDNSFPLEIQIPTYNNEDTEEKEALKRKFVINEDFTSDINEIRTFESDMSQVKQVKSYADNAIHMQPYEKETSNNLEKNIYVNTEKVSSDIVLPIKDVITRQYENITPENIAYGNQDQPYEKKLSRNTELYARNAEAIAIDKTQKSTEDVKPLSKTSFQETSLQKHRIDISQPRSIGPKDAKNSRSYPKESMQEDEPRPSRVMKGSYNALTNYPSQKKISEETSSGGSKGLFTESSEKILPKILRTGRTSTEDGIASEQSKTGGLHSDVQAYQKGAKLNKQNFSLYKTKESSESFFQPTEEQTRKDNKRDIPSWDRARYNASEGKISDRTWEKTTLENIENGLRLMSESGVAEGGKNYNRGSENDMVRSEISSHDHFKAQSGFHNFSISNNIINRPSQMISQYREDQGLVKSTVSEMDLPSHSLFKPKGQIFVPGDHTKREDGSDQKYKRYILPGTNSSRNKYDFDSQSDAGSSEKKRKWLNGETAKQSSSRESVFLNLVFQTFIDEDEPGVKTLDSSNGYDAKNVVVVKSLVRSQDNKGEITVPISSKHVMKIHIEAAPSGISKRGSKVPSKSEKSRNTLTSHAAISRVIHMELVPLQRVIKNLKEDIDCLAVEQILLRDRLNQIPRKSKPSFNKKCGCLKRTCSNRTE